MSLFLGFGVLGRSNWTDPPWNSSFPFDQHEFHETATYPMTLSEPAGHRIKQMKTPSLESQRISWLQQHKNTRKKIRRREPDIQTKMKTEREKGGKR
jgi:hypothetical protein